MVEEDLAFRTFDAASAGLDAVRRRAGGGSADGPGLPGTRNGRRFGLNRRPSGGCRIGMIFAARVCRPLRGILVGSHTHCVEQQGNWGAFSVDAQRSVL